MFGLTVTFPNVTEPLSKQSLVEVSYATATQLGLASHARIQLGMSGI